LARSTESASSARRAQGEESRQRLVEAAVALISERGYAATSVGDICRRAGVAKTALYWHFESKEGLLAAVLETVGSRWIEEIEKQVYLQGDPIQRLNGLVDGWRRVLREEPQLLRLHLFLQLEQGDASEPTRAALEALFHRAERAIVRGIEDTVGCRDVADLDLAAHTILALLQGAALRVSMLRDEAEIDRVFDECRRTVILVLWSRLPEATRVALEDEVRRRVGSARGSARGTSDRGLRDENDRP